MSSTHLRNIAIVGASGQSGSSIFKHLLATSLFHITVITRAESKATFPESTSITVKKGSYDDNAFLKSAFTNQDAAIFALNFKAMDVQTTLITAAAEAGVKWIVPTEYAGDGMNQAMMDAFPMFAPKVAAREHIDDLAKTHKGLKWIGVATNPWADYMLTMVLSGSDIAARKVVLYSDAGPLNISTLEQVGLGVARILSLPVENAENPRSSLQYYGNNFAYISSALTTQKEVFQAVLEATKTSESEWSFESAVLAERMQSARERMAKGDFSAAIEVASGVYLIRGMGGDYEDRAKVDREVLGLMEEPVADMVRRAIESK